MKETLLKIRDLTIGHKGKPLCSGICFDICKGDCIMLCGANGSGKTTLLKALTAMSEDIVMIPTGIPKTGGFTLKEFVRIGCYRQTDMGGRLSAQDEKTLEDALQQLGISHIADQDISTLSDGEFQKAGIASALVRKASILLLDEPTAFLDAENRIAVLRTLRELCDGSGTAVIFSTHDLHDGRNAATKVCAIGVDGIFRSSEDDMDGVIGSIFRRNETRNRK